MKLIIKGMLIGSLLTVGAIAKDNNTTQKEVKKASLTKLDIPTTDIQIFSSDNKNNKITTKTIEEAFKKAGFFISANRDMNKPFIKQFKESDFQTYNLFTFYKKDVVLELAKKYPNVGLFAPMSIYSKKGSTKISVSMLSAKAIEKIMGIKGEEKILTDLKKLVIDTLQKAMPKGKLVTNFTMEMDKDEWEDELEDFKMGFEGDLATNGFIIAGQNNLGDDFDDANYNGYDIYEVYSICI